MNEPSTTNGPWVRPKPNKQFRFENYWAKESGCEEVVKKIWVQKNSMTNQHLRRMGGAIDKIKRTRDSLGLWARKEFHGQRRSIRKVEDELEAASLKPGSSNSKEIIQLKKEILSLQRIENDKWAQRARLCWMQEGDVNSRYFHAVATDRQRKNFIHGLKDDSGKWNSSFRNMGHCKLLFPEFV